MAVLFRVHRVQLVADQVVVLQRDGPLLLDDHSRGTAERPDPLAELLRVADGRGQTHDGDAEREMDEDLLPHGAAVRVLQVMDLVHHDERQALEGVAPLVEHVPEDLGGHHHHRRLGVDRVVAGEQADPSRAVPGHEVPELLVRQRL